MKKIVAGAITVIIAILIYWFYTKEDNPQFYINQITLYRHERAEFFRYSPNSPFIQQKVNFSYLDYYSASPEFVIKANFKKTIELDTVNLATSTGTIDEFIAIGTANFNIQGVENSLFVLKSIHPNDQSLFIPYIDKTSGESTYGGGRYLDVQNPNGNIILLDFNKAYNPYCAYTEGYTCPFPPKENRLSVLIEAGEKSYPSH